MFIWKAKKNIYFKGIFYFSTLRIDGLIGLLPFGFEQKTRKKQQELFFEKHNEKEQKKLDSDHGIIIMSLCGNKIKVMRIDGTMVKSN